MTWRFFGFLVFQLAGGLVGWYFGQETALGAGLVAGGLGWLALDSLHAVRVQRWLRRGDFSSVPPVSGVWAEVSERTRRVLRLREQEQAQAVERLQEFLAAIQASPSGVVLLDSQGRIEWCNQTAAEQFGFDPQRDLQQQVAHLVRDPAFTSYYNGGRYEHEILIAGPRGSASRPVRLSLQLHPYGEGRRLLLSRDVTAVEQVELMRRDFIANVSHEIRTPLTVLAGFVETLQNLPLDGPERARFLGMMAQQAQRMQTLVDDLLTLSRLEGSPLAGHAEWNALETLTAQSEQDARTLTDLLGKSLELRFAPAPALEIAGSGNELLSGMFNLVSNAVRYTQPMGEIQVQWREMPDGRAEFSVRDSGPGIAPEHIARVTERFYRIDRSRSRETGGTGLGLAIVKHVAQRHGGELKIDSTLGVGSTFTIVFPADRLRSTVKPDACAQPASKSLAGSG